MAGDKRKKCNAIDVGGRKKYKENIEGIQASRNMMNLWKSKRCHRRENCDEGEKEKSCRGTAASKKEREKLPCWGQMKKMQCNRCWGQGEIQRKDRRNISFEEYDESLEIKEMSSKRKTVMKARKEKSSRGTAGENNIKKKENEKRGVGWGGTREKWKGYSEKEKR